MIDIVGVDMLLVRPCHTPAVERREPSRLAELHLAPLWIRTSLCCNLLVQTITRLTPCTCQLVEIFHSLMLVQIRPCTTLWPARDCELPSLSCARAGSVGNYGAKLGGLLLKSVAVDHDCRCDAIIVLNILFIHLQRLLVVILGVVSSIIYQPSSKIWLSRDHGIGGRRCVMDVMRIAVVLLALVLVLVLVLVLAFVCVCLSLPIAGAPHGPIFVIAPALAQVRAIAIDGIDMARIVIHDCPLR